jgi:hypothetical protein
MMGMAITTDQLTEALARHLAEHQVTPWGTTLQHLALWSPGILILAGLFLLLRRPPEFIAQFVAAQQAMAAAMQGLARSVDHAGSQGSAMQTEVLRRLDAMDLDIRLVIDRLQDNDRRAHEVLGGIAQSVSELHGRAQ